MSTNGNHHETNHVAQVPLLVLDKRGCVVLLSASAERLFGYRADDLLGQSMWLLFPDGESESVAAQVESLLDDSGCNTTILRIAQWAVRQDRSEFPAQVHLSPFDLDGCRFVLVTVRDTACGQRLATYESLREQSANTLHQEALVGTQRFIYSLISRVALVTEAAGPESINY